ncbi:MAG: helix-turn-helix transcriptional regulator [Planctomycetia bacterium]|nr:helix-turn-helix transcriptional regulator [Planctomycetia bacterium]
MIRSEAEYKIAVRRLSEQSERLKQQAVHLRKTELTKDEVKRVLDPVRCFHEQLKEEVQSYERLKRGEFDELQNLSGMGQLLVALRIAKGVTQRELAKRLDVSESQVSRDERNEYHGITVDRAQRVLEALGVTISTEVVSLDGSRSKRASLART